MLHCAVLQLYADMANFAADMISGGPMSLMIQQQAAGTSAAEGDDAVPSIKAMEGTTEADPAMPATTPLNGCFLVPAAEVEKLSSHGFQIVRYQLPFTGEPQRDVRCGTGWVQ